MKKPKYYVEVVGPELTELSKANRIQYIPVEGEHLPYVGTVPLIVVAGIQMDRPYGETLEQALASAEARIAIDACKRAYGE